MACDGAITSGGALVSNSMKKIYKVGTNSIIGFAGLVVDCMLFIENKDVDYKKSFTTLQDYAETVNVVRLDRDGCIYTLESSESADEEGKCQYVWLEVGNCNKGDFYSIGSGSSFALGALAQGADAAEAVKVASKFDLGTSGELYTCSFNKKKSKR